jgi:hypothetical protein
MGVKLYTDYHNNIVDDEGNIIVPAENEVY